MSDKIAAIAAGVGQLTGAAGQLLGGMTAGTQECGARPLLAKNRGEWNACVARNTAIREQATMNQMNNRTSEQAATNPLVIVGIVAVVVVVLILIFKKK
jgi:hypothetical protein